MTTGSVKVDTNSRLSRNLGLLQAGSTITLDIFTPAGQKQKFRTIFVGYLPKNYILIQYPDASKLGHFAQHITQGTSVTVRGLIEGAVVAFSATIKQTIQIPSRLMVLAFPKDVSLQNLRSSIRIDTEIESKIKIQNQYWQATMTDLSINGCQLAITSGESLILADKQDVEISISNFRKLKTMTLSALVCNVKQRSQDVFFGVKFKAESKNLVVDLLHHAVTKEEI